MTGAVGVMRQWLSACTPAAFMLSVSNYAHSNDYIGASSLGASNQSLADTGGIVLKLVD